MLKGVLLEEAEVTGLNEEVKLQLKPKRPREATHVKGVIVGGGNPRWREWQERGP